MSGENQHACHGQTYITYIGDELQWVISTAWIVRFGFQSYILGHYDHQMEKEIGNDGILACYPLYNKIC